MKSYRWYIIERYKDADGEWRKLERATGTSDYRIAKAILDSIISSRNSAPSAESSDYKSSLYKAWRGASWRSSKRGIDICVSFKDIMSIFDSQKGRCAVTGIPFDCARPGASSSRCRAFAPSIDRIDASFGYTPDNVRLVCVAANFAMNQWGESVLAQISSGYVATNVMKG